MYELLEPGHQLLNQYEQGLATLRSSSKGRLKNNKHLNLLLAPPASRAEEPAVSWRRRDEPASPLADVVQSANGAASPTLAPHRESKGQLNSTLYGFIKVSNDENQRLVETVKRQQR